VQGGFIESDNPSIVFPKHTIQRSSLAPRSLQRVCTSFQVTQAPSPPATTWPIVYTSGQYCTWLRPGFYALLGDHPWTDAKTQVEYHVSFVVSWSTKTKKKLARATYDFDTVNDYKCLTTICHVGQAADSTTYIVFDL
jgi:hypothetical protein